MDQLISAFHRVVNGIIFDYSFSVIGRISNEVDIKDPQNDITFFV